MNSFPCYQCGLCCQHVHLAAETRFLDRGDGSCKNFDALKKSCTIYAQRPDICRVDRQYTLRYSKQYTWDEFVALNLQVCASLDVLGVWAAERIFLSEPDNLAQGVNDVQAASATAIAAAKKLAATLVFKE